MAPPVMQWVCRTRGSNDNCLHARSNRSEQTMARKVQVILSDDLDDSISADETATFALDGTTYEIDLSEQNAAELRDVFGKYVSAARKGSSRGGRASGGGRSRATGGGGGGRMDREQAGAIRDWARKNG